MPVRPSVRPSVRVRLRFLLFDSSKLRSCVTQRPFTAAAFAADRAYYVHGSLKASNVAFFKEASDDALLSRSGQKMGWQRPGGA